MVGYSLNPITTICLFGMVAVASAAADGRPPALELHPKVRPLSVPHMGPFVRLADDTIVGIESEAVIRSTDGGKTWATSPLFNKEQMTRCNLKVRDERALGITAEGTIVLAFVDGNARHWTWEKKIHDAPGAMLPTWVIRSTDGGKTWTDLQKLHDDWTGAVRDIIQTRNGRIIFTSMKLLHNPGRHACVNYVSDDQGVSWKASNVIDLGGSGNHGGAMEPTLVELRDGRVWMLIRTNWSEFWSAYSYDGGRFFRTFQSSGISASTAPGVIKRLASGRLMLVWNREFPEGKSSYAMKGGDGDFSDVRASTHREELSLAFSDDDGATWSKPVVMARIPGGALAYPYIFERSPGLLWVTTWQGRLRVELNESDFVSAKQ